MKIKANFVPPGTQWNSSLLERSGGYGQGSSSTIIIPNWLTNLFNILEGIRGTRIRHTVCFGTAVRSASPTT